MSEKGQVLQTEDEDFLLRSFVFVHTTQVIIETKFGKITPKGTCGSSALLCWACSQHSVSFSYWLYGFLHWEKHVQYIPL